MSQSIVNAIIAAGLPSGIYEGSRKTSGGNFTFAPGGPYPRTALGSQWWVSATEYWARRTSLDGRVIPGGTCSSGGATGYRVTREDPAGTIIANNVCATDSTGVTISLGTISTNQPGTGDTITGYDCVNGNCVARVYGSGIPFYSSATHGSAAAALAACRAGCRGNCSGCPPGHVCFTEAEAIQLRDALKRANIEMET